MLSLLLFITWPQWCLPIPAKLKRCGQAIRKGYIGCLISVTHHPVTGIAASLQLRSVLRTPPELSDRRRSQRRLLNRSAVPSCQKSPPLAAVQYTATTIGQTYSGTTGQLDTRSPITCVWFRPLPRESGFTLSHLVNVGCKLGIKVQLRDL